MIKNLRDLSKKDISIAGGKGANLGELIQAGMPVPPGFVITAKAHKSFAKTKIPKSLEKKILKAYQALGGGAVAVRSSATAEDLPEAAFAGQHDSYLNIIGEKKLLEAIKHTWASLWTDRAVAYRKHHGIDTAKLSMAVIVQRMVDADFAGVMFTANPVTGDRKEIIIDAVEGLGEAVVSGSVTPDHFVMRRKWHRWRMTKKPTKTSLPEKQLISLTKLGAKIEKHFGSPQDIEWAFLGKELFIVQSRPITALPTQPIKQNRFGHMMASTLAEMMPNRPLPLEATTLGPKLIIDEMLVPVLKILGLRIPAYNKLIIEEEGIPARYNGHMRLRPKLSIIFAPFRLIRLAIKNKVVNWREDPLVEEILRSVKAVEDKQIEKNSPKEAMASAREAYGIFQKVIELRIKYLAGAVLSLAGLYMMLTISRSRHLFATLLYSDMQTKVIETNAVLEELSAKISANKTLLSIFQKNEAAKIIPKLKANKAGQEFLKEFQDFLKKYGYREAGGTLLISNSTWKESPETVLGVLKGTVGTLHKPKTKENWEDIRDKLMNKIIFKIPMARSLFLRILRAARHFHGLREDTRFYLMMPISPLRKSIFTIAAHLKKAKLIKETEDVFYLQFDELNDLAKSFPLKKNKIEKYKKIISKRMIKYSELQNIPFVNPELYRAKSEKNNSDVLGSPGSPGIAEGIARIIHDSSEFHKLKPNEILVAPYTNPSWTPLFERISAVVVDTGGIMSHAAIVAREYGIPAVMGTVDGTKKIQNGSKIRVNGTSGQIVVF